MERYIFHVATESEWFDAQSSRTYRPLTYADDGFIHCCFETQIAHVLNEYFEDVTNLLLLKIDPTSVQDQTRLEASPTGEKFPHLYGELPVSVVVEVRSLGDHSTSGSPTHR